MNAITHNDAQRRDELHEAPVTGTLAVLASLGAIAALFSVMMVV